MQVDATAYIQHVSCFNKKYVTLRITKKNKTAKVPKAVNLIKTAITDHCIAVADIKT